MNKVVLIISLILFSHNIGSAQYLELFYIPTEGTRQIEYSPNGNFIASVEIFGSTYMISMWDANTGIKLWSGLHSDLINDISFSSDGSKIASCSNDETIKVWNSANGEINWIGNHYDRVYAIKFAMDDTKIISGGGVFARIWNSLTGSLEMTLNIENSILNSKALAVCPNDSIIAIGDNNIIRLYNLQTGNILWEKQQGYRITQIDFNSDGTRLVSGDNSRINLWDAYNGELLWFNYNGATSLNSLSFNNNGSLIVRGTVFNDKVEIINSLTGELIWTKSAPTIKTVKFNHLGDKIAVVYDKKIEIYRANDGISLWLGYHYDSNYYRLFDLEFNPDDQKFSSGGQDGIRVWLEQPDYLLSLTKDSLYFSKVPIHSSKELSFSIINLGLLNNSISNVSIDNAEFDYSFENLGIPSGDSSIIKIKFIPKEIGDSKGLLTFYDTGNNFYSVELNGIGVMPEIKLKSLYSGIELPSYVKVLFQTTTLDDEGLVGYTNHNNLIIKEDNQEISAINSQPILEDFKAVPFELKTTILIDNSFEVGAQLNDIKNSLSQFIQNIPNYQKIALVSFSESIDMLQDYTNNKDELANSISNISMGSPSRNLYGAIIEGSNMWENIYSDSIVSHGNIILLTFGDDTQGLFTLQQALNSIKEKNIYTVAIGEANNSEFVSQLYNKKLFQIETTDLPTVFEEISDLFFSDVYSMHWFAYISPKRGPSTHTLSIELDGNSNFGEGSVLSVQFNSNDFSGVLPSIYINRTFSKLKGIDSVNLISDDSILTARTLFGLNESDFVWQIEDESKIIISEVISNDSIRISDIIKDGSETFLTIKDSANNFTKIVNVTSQKLLPTRPVLIFPLNNSNNVELNLYFKWIPGARTLYSDIQISTDSLFNLAEEITNISSDSIFVELDSAYKYYWRVKSVNNFGSSQWSEVFSFTTRDSVTSVSLDNIPEYYYLSQNYPNPFNPSTIIKYGLPEESNVKVNIYSILGEEISELVNTQQSAGYYNITWNALNLSSGIYLVRISANSIDGKSNFTDVKKMLLIK